MSKMSMPCILPRISRRSRPVDWLRSVGTVPGSAPGGRRSSIVLTSAQQKGGSAYDGIVGGEGRERRVRCLTVAAREKGGTVGERILGRYQVP